MRRVLSCLMAIAILSTGFSVGASAESAGAWHQTNYTFVDGSGSVQDTLSGTSDTVTTIDSYTGTQGNIEISHNRYSDSDGSLIAGISFAVLWSDPPSAIQAGDKVSVDYQLRILSTAGGWTNPNQNYVAISDGQGGKFLSPEGIQYITKDIDTTLTCERTISAGSDGKEITLTMEFGYGYQAVYTYRWSAAGSDAPSASPFTDIPDDAWYRNDVESAYKNGLINGKTATTYSPDSSMTYAETIKLAACMHQLYHDGKVTLTNGEPFWYTEYLTYALMNNIIAELYDDYDAKATREDFVHIFFGALPATEYGSINVVADGAIPDVPMSGNHADEIYTFYRAGILTGSDSLGTFNPLSSIRRSEVAAILTRMFDDSARKSITLW
jgi:hypothetical protein